MRDPRGQGRESEWVRRGGERRTHSCGRERKNPWPGRGEGGRRRGDLSIAPVERKREWEKAREKEREKRVTRRRCAREGRGIYSGTSSLSTTE